MNNISYKGSFLLNCVDDPLKVKNDNIRRFIKEQRRIESGVPFFGIRVTICFPEYIETFNLGSVKFEDNPLVEEFGFETKKERNAFLKTLPNHQHVKNMKNGVFVCS